MDKIDSVTKYLSYTDEIKKNKKGYATNFFPNLDQLKKWIEAGLFNLALGTQGCVLFIKNDNGFDRIFYCVSSLVDLEIGLKEIKYDALSTNVVDLIGEEQVLNPLKILLIFFVMILKIEKNVYYFVCHNGISFSLYKMFLYIYVHI